MEREHCYFTYLMASRSRTLYCGVTSDLAIRVKQHRNGTLGGFTSQYKCTRLVGFERFGFIEDAIDREKEIKGWRREKKIALIVDRNPTWEDLSEAWGLSKLSTTTPDLSSRAERLGAPRAGRARWGRRSEGPAFSGVPLQG